MLPTQISKFKIAVLIPTFINPKRIQPITVKKQATDYQYHPARQNKF
jgi:hypothetical protein